MSATPIVPTITEENRPFWDAARAERLEMQRCSACRHVRYPISAVCPRCLDAAAEWIELSGRGSVLSFVVFERAYNPAWADRVPYNVALIQLAEGPRMFSNVVGVPNEAVAVGMPVRVVFEPVAGTDVVLPRFTPE